MQFLINLLLWISFACSLTTLLAGIVVKSSKWTFISSVMLLPISYYFVKAGANLSLFMYLPIFPFFLSIYYLLKRRPNKPFDGYQ